MAEPRTLPAVFLAFSVLLLFGCAGYVPGEKAYWDSRVKELCAKGGGVRIFERPRLSMQEAAKLTRGGGRISVPAQELASDSPFYARSKDEYVRKGDPQVTRRETFIVRRRDDAVVASWVIYRRSGRDFPSHAYPSSFQCPDMVDVSAALQELFIVEREEK